MVLDIRILGKDVIMIGSEDSRYGLYIMGEIPSLILMRLAGVLGWDHSRMIENRVHHEGFLLPIFLCAGLSDACRLGEVVDKLMDITAHLSRFYNPSKILELTLSSTYGCMPGIRSLGSGTGKAGVTKLEEGKSACCRR